MCGTSYKSSPKLARADRNLRRYPSLAATRPPEEASMRSFRSQIGIIPAVAALWLAACGGSSAPSSSAPTASPSSAALIHTGSVKGGGNSQTVAERDRGLPLDYSTPATEPPVACTGGCAPTGPPLLASSGTPTSNPALPGNLAV